MQFDLKVRFKINEKNFTYLQYFYIKILAKNKFNNIITNNGKSINLNLINKRKKKTYKKTLKRNNNIKKDLDNNIISKEI